MQATIRGLLACATVLVVGFVIAIGAVSAQDTMKPGDMKKDEMKKVDKAKASPDSKFVEDAAIGGMAEVELGKLAAEKATSADVKQFAQRMVDDHSKANEELSSLASSKGITLPTAVDAKVQAHVEHLSKLSGAEFDQEYMKMMVSDHDKDVAEFEREANSGKDPDVKAWASKTLPTLREHQTMAKSISTSTAGAKKTT